MSDDARPFGEEQIERAWSLLERDGYFNDESSGLGSDAVEYHLEQVEAALRARGYDGPPLEHNAHHYSKRGAVYWAYDSRRVNARRARTLTDQWVRQQLRQ